MGIIILYKCNEVISIIKVVRLKCDDDDDDDEDHACP